MLLGVLSVCTFGLSQTQPTFTYTCRAKAISLVLEDFVKETGIKVKASTVGVRPVVLKVDNMPTRRFLDELARVTYSHWEQQGDWSVLVRPADWANRLNSDSMAMRTKAIEKQLQSNAVSLGRGLDFSDKAVKGYVASAIAERRQHQDNPVGSSQVAIRVGNHRPPSSFLLIEALRRIPAKTYASIGLNECLVFSSLPNRYQRALPYPPSAIAEYLGAQRKLASAVKQLPPSDLYKYYIGNSGYSSPGAKAQAPFSKFLIRIRNQHLSYLTIELFVVSELGEILDQQSVGVSIQPNSPDVAGSELITLSPESMKLVKAVGAVGGSREEYPTANWSGPAMTKEVREIIIDPVKHEPLSFHVSDVLLGVATKSQKQLIAAPPDSTFQYLAALGINGKVRYYPSFLSLVGGSIRVDGDVMSVRASDSIGAEETDRGALAKVMGALNERGFARLSEIIDYASTVRLPAQHIYLGVGEAVISMVSPETIEQIRSATRVSIEAYRSLGVAQLSGGTAINIPSRSWTPKLENLVLTQLLNNAYGIYFQSGTTQIEQQEITEALMRFNFADLQMLVTKHKSDVVYASDEKGNHAFLQGGQLIQSKNRYKSYRMANLEFIMMTPALASQPLNQGGWGYLRDVFITGDKDLSYAELPESLLKQAKQPYQNYIYADYKYFPGNRGKIPPHP